MAATIKQYHEAIMAGPRKGEAERFLKRLTSGTTSRWEEQRLLYFGRHLALVAWDYGEKAIVIVESPKAGPSEPERRALRSLGMAATLPTRIAPAALSALIARVAAAEDRWAAETRSHAEVIRAENAAAQALRNDRTASARTIAQALAVLAAAARKDGTLYHDALSDLTVEGPVLKGRAGPFTVTIAVTVY